MSRYPWTASRHRRVEETVPHRSPVRSGILRIGALSFGACLVFGLVSLGGAPVRGAAQAPGPLRVHPENPRYFTADGSTPVLLVGSNEGWELQDDAWGTSENRRLRRAARPPGGLRPQRAPHVDGRAHEASQRPGGGGRAAHAVCALGAGASARRPAPLRPFEPGRPLFRAPAPPRRRRRASWHLRHRHALPGSQRLGRGRVVRSLSECRQQRGRDRRRPRWQRHRRRGAHPGLATGPRRPGAVRPPRGRDSRRRRERPLRDRQRRPSRRSGLAVPLGSISSVSWRRSSACGTRSA